MDLLDIYCRGGFPGNISPFSHGTNLVESSPNLDRNQNGTRYP